MEDFVFCGGVCVCVCFLVLFSFNSLHLLTIESAVNQCWCKGSDNLQLDWPSYFLVNNIGNNVTFLKTCS